MSGSCVSLLLFCFAVAPQPQQAQTVSAEVHPDRTITFRLSAPKANEVTVAVNGLPAERLTRMEKDEKGMWSEPSVGFGSISAQNSDRAAFTRDRLEDVMPLAEKLYRISAKPESRAIAGLSMGGGQSMNIGLTHLELFHWIGIFSAGMRSDSEKTFANPAASNKKIKLLWIGIGRKDASFESAQQFSEVLKKHEIKHTFHSSEGAHTWTVWRHYLNEFAPLLFR